jgi:hypothetical protein
MVEDESIGVSQKKEHRRRAQIKLVIGGGAVEAI